MLLKWMKSLWRHIAYNLREGGLRQVALKVVSKTIHYVWSQDVWLIYYSEGQSSAGPTTVSLKHRRLSLDELQHFEYYKAVSFPEMVKKRLDKGATCHGFFLDNDLAHIAWTTRAYLELEAGLDIPDPRCVGIFDCFTPPAHRGKGIYPTVLTRLLSDDSPERAESYLIAVDPGNLPSIKGIERAGFTPLYELKRTRRLGRNLIQKRDFQPRFVGSPSDPPVHQSSSVGHKV